MANFNLPPIAGSAASIISAVKNKKAKDIAGAGVKAKFPENVDKIRHMKISAFKTNTSVDEAKEWENKDRFYGTIVMPLPVEIMYQNSVIFKNADLLAPMADGGFTASKIDDLLVKAGATMLKGVAKQLLSKVGGDAGQSILDTAQQALGARINPFTESLFEGPALREFQFNFLLYARTENEAIQIERIKRFIRYHQYPAKFGVQEVLKSLVNGSSAATEAITNQVDSGNKDPAYRTGTFLGHPSDFVIRFYEPDGKKRLDSTNYIFPCNVVNMTVVENPQGNPAWLRGSDGTSYPASTQLNITVKERQMITRNDWAFLDGYSGKYGDLYPVATEPEKTDNPLEEYDKKVWVSGSEYAGTRPGGRGR